MSPVGATSVKMAVWKTSIIREVHLFSDTVVCAFSKAAFGEILASIRCHKIPQLQYIFVAVAAWTLRGAAEHGPVRFCTHVLLMILLSFYGSFYWWFYSHSTGDFNPCCWLFMALSSYKFRPFLTRLQWLGFSWRGFNVLPKYTFKVESRNIIVSSIGFTILKIWKRICIGQKHILVTQYYM